MKETTLERLTRDAHVAFLEHEQIAAGLREAQAVVSRLQKEWLAAGAKRQEAEDRLLDFVRTGTEKAA